MTLNNSNKRIKIGTIFSYLSIAVNILSGLLFTPWLIRCLGKSDYGLYTLSISLINLLLVDFGISAAVSKYISLANANKNSDEANSYSSLFFSTYLFIDLFIAIALILMYFFLGNIYTTLAPDELERFRIVYIISASFNIIVFPYNSLTSGILNSYELFSEQKITSILAKILPIIAIALLLFFSKSLFLVVLVHSLFSLFAIMTRILIIHRKTPIRIKPGKLSRTALKGILGFTAWTAITGIADRILNNIEPTILGSVAGTSEIAVFGIAVSIESYVYAFTTAINGLFMPRITKLNLEHNDKKISELMLFVGRILYVLTGLIFVGFICIGRHFIILWVGHDYQIAYYCTILLIAPYLFIRPQQIANTTMIVKGYVKPIAITDIFVLIVTICLSFLFAAFYGALGAAFALCVSSLIGSIAKMFLYKKYLNLDLKVFVIRCYIKIGVPILLCSIIAVFINVFIKTSIINVLIYGAAITLAFILALAIFSFNKDEIKSLIHKIRKI